MTAKRTIVYFTVEPEIRNRFKAAAALQGKSLREWALEAMRAKADIELRALADAGSPADLPAPDALKDALRVAAKLHPRIAAGTRGRVDAARDVAAVRSGRLKALGG